ncbi:MAG: TrmB family transcriptional regulator [Chloroflexi bacterium]|nr:TrmB family transcriptional regulator [Chloroflexota bacterium]
MTEPLLGQLSRLGLTNDEARCYATLVSRGGLTASQLCTATGVTRGRIYDVVRGLLSKGVVLETATNVRRFEAVSPPVAVTNLLERRHREDEGLERSAQQVIESLQTSAATGEAPPTLLEVIRHRATLRQRCGQLERAAVEEILFFVRDQGQVAGDLVEESAALRRGVRLRALYESSLLRTPYLETMQRFLASGGEGRHVPVLATRLTVIDERVTMLPLHEATLAAREFTVLVIHHAGMSALAASAFERIWTDACPIPEHSAG